MAAWPTLKEVRSVLRMQPDATEDGIIQSALSAAIAYGLAKYGPLVYQSDSVDVSDNAHEACLLDACRLYRRRDSLDGTISWGDGGAMRVGRTDPDVERLYALGAPVVFG